MKRKAFFKFFLRGFAPSGTLLLLLEKKERKEEVREKKKGMPSKFCLLNMWLVFWSIPTATATVRTLTKPHIVFIMADDLGYFDVGCNDNTIIIYQSGVR